MLRSAAVLAGLVLNATLVGLLIAGFLFKEGREAIEQVHQSHRSSVIGHPCLIKTDDC